MYSTKNFDYAYFIALLGGIAITLFCVAVIETAKDDYVADCQSRIEQKCVDESGHFERECPSYD